MKVTKDSYIEDMRLEQSRQALGHIKMALIGVHLTEEDAEVALHYVSMSAPVRMTIMQKQMALQELPESSTEGRKFRE